MTAEYLRWDRMDWTGEHLIRARPKEAQADAQRVRKAYQRVPDERYRKALSLGLDAVSAAEFCGVTRVAIRHAEIRLGITFPKQGPGRK